MVGPTYPTTGCRLIAVTAPKYLLGEYGFARKRQVTLGRIHYVQDGNVVPDRA